MDQSTRSAYLVFYNVENLYDVNDDPSTGDNEFLPRSKRAWAIGRYHHKLRQLARVIRYCGEPLPLITGLAEVENRKVLHDLILAMGLTEDRAGIIHVDSPDERGMDVAMIYDRRLFNPVRMEALRVCITSDPEDATRDILYVEGRVGDRVRSGDVPNLHVYVNHWPSRREGDEATRSKRLDAGQTLQKHINQLLDDDPGANIVVMGDFNATPEDAPVRHLLDWEHGNDGMLVNLSWEAFRQGSGSTCYRRRWLLFDQILASPGLMKAEQIMQIDAASFQIIKEPWMLYQNPVYKDNRPDRTYGGRRYQGGYSDHLPVRVRLLF